ncbi:putative membrane protein [Campylobacter iguaniorum]|uniref:hypothetical protein n=1 Tax=Campylobacter iguaniorum TaxID=1244531 RepID=UPI00073A1567|nr:hypothetical protein [Campylobacter iguaniorum]ALV24829.1 putative membrane protein [Campylobacter iguaniorum]
MIIPLVIVTFIVNMLFASTAEDNKTDIAYTYIDKSINFQTSSLFSSGFKGKEQMITDIMLCLFGLIAFIALMILLSKKIKAIRNKKTIVIETIKKPLYMAKINTDPTPSKLAPADITHRISFSFNVIYKKCAKNNNTVIFDFDPSFHRHFLADHKSITYLIHFILEFCINLVKNSTIVVSFDPINLQKDIHTYNVSIKINQNIIEIENKIKDALLQKSNYLHYKKLVLASKIANNLGTHINYSNGYDEFQFDFDLNLIPQDQFVATKFIQTPDPTKAVIASDDMDSYNTLVKQLTFFGIKVEPINEWAIVKKHIITTIFNPNLVFIQAKILARLPQAELTELKEAKERKSLSIIVISNNTNYDKIINSLDFEAYKLKQPYTSDYLLAILNKTQKNAISKLWGGYEVY